jgi:5-methyltetrahydropteroyltriglutamate--homocysteine methyltransferase
VVESKAEIKKRIQKAMEIIPLEKIYVDPDCGLKTRTLEEAKQKLANMVAAVQELRAELLTRT